MSLVSKYYFSESFLHISNKIESWKLVDCFCDKNNRVDSLLREMKSARESKLDWEFYNLSGNAYCQLFSCSTSMVFLKGRDYLSSINSLNTFEKNICHNTYKYDINV